MTELLAAYQLEVVGALVVVTACAIIYVFITYEQKRKIQAERRPSVASMLFGSANDGDGRAADLNDDEQEAPQRTIKKSISFNTVYNLEEFMVRLYKIGFYVVRLKSDGARKERFLSIDQKGNICFHKMAAVQQHELPRRYPTPYFRLPVTKLRECFVCEESPEPSFIMDFKSKTLHLAVNSLTDRDYIVKGIKLIVQRAKNNSNFLLRSSSLLESAPSPQDSIRTEHDQYDDDLQTQTTMNTNYHRR